MADLTPEIKRMLHEAECRGAEMMRSACIDVAMAVDEDGSRIFAEATEFRDEIEAIVVPVRGKEHIHG